MNCVFKEIVRGYLSLKMFQLILLTSFVAAAFGAKCPSGGEIYAWGISEQGKRDTISVHNKYRTDIANGRVRGQPRAVNMKRLVYDDKIGQGGALVSKTCKMEHVIYKDDRWNWVGQNLFISWDTKQNTQQNWTQAVTSWFAEHLNFRYPDSSTNGKEIGHYKALAWADSKYLGCHFVAFRDTNKPKYPYAKLYTCNYGPGGNYPGQAPYRTGTSGCENLC